MEEEKKKKKNKKKKKQNKTIDDEAGSVDHNDVAAQNHHSQVVETAILCNGVVQNCDGDLDQQRPQSTEGSVLSEAEKQYWLQREASLEERVEQLQNEQQSHIQKEAVLETRIVQLESEKESWLLKEAILEQRINLLLDEKAIFSSKGASLEEKINQLLDEKTILSATAANLEERIKHLEKEKDTWVLKENSTKEIIASLNYENTRQRMQVTEVEESRSKILQENQLLKENISSLQSQIQNLENTSCIRSSTESTKVPEKEDLDSQIEAARALIDKLVVENAELVEKVNELYIDIDRQGVGSGLASAFETDEEAGNTETFTVDDTTVEPSKVSVLGERMESLDNIPMKNEMVDDNNLDSNNVSVIVNSSETSESGEIVQIPLHENQVQDVESQAAGSDEKGVVPISDAPLIGAPFRLISFVAKYVSGADLVNKSAS